MNELNAMIRRLAAIGLACSAAGAFAADPGQFSQAERQLFVRPHLERLTPPVRLHYRYERRGTIEPEATDDAIVSLDGEGGVSTASVRYLSDDRKLELPAIDSVAGNPVVLYFLEREVRELKRLTGGSVSFYRNRIRKALAGDATVRETQVSYDGRSVKATEIRIDPYVDDPARSRFEKFAERYYVMVLSPEIPGEVYRMKAELKGSAGTPEAGRILHSETLVFDRQDGGRARRGQ